MEDYKINLAFIACSFLKEFIRKHLLLLIFPLNILITGVKRAVDLFLCPHSKNVAILEYANII